MGALMLWCRNCGAVWLSSPAQRLAEQRGCLRCDGPLVRVLESDETIERRRMTSRLHVGPSEEIRLVSRVFELLARRDVQALVEVHDPEVVIDVPRGFEESESYSGHDGLLSGLRQLDDEWIEFEAELHALREVEEGVAAEGVVSGRRKNGHRVEAPATWLFELEGGKVRRMSVSLEAARCDVAGGDQGLRT